MIEVKDTRATAMDINDNVLVIGNSKGYITAYEQTWEKKTMNVGVSFNLNLIVRHSLPRDQTC